jgi:hypothetical protein
MKQGWVKLIAVMVAAAMVLAGVGAVAFAQGGSNSPQQGGLADPGGPGHGYISVLTTTLGMSEADIRTALQSGKSIADIAASKNVSLDKVVNAIVTSESDQLKTQVSASRITQAQMDAQVAWLKANLAKILAIPPAPLGGFGIGDFGGMRGGPAGQSGPGGHGGPFGANSASSPFAIAAKALGISEADLMTAMQGGKSVATLAKEKNVSLDTIIASAVSAESDALKAEVTAGRLTQAQADQRLTGAKDRITNLFNNTMPQGGPGRGGFPRGNGPQRGPAPLATPGTN